LYILILLSLYRPTNANIKHASAILKVAIFDDILSKNNTYHSDGQAGIIVVKFQI